MSIVVPEKFQAPVDLFITLVVGTIAFLMVFGAALLISLLVKLSESVAPKWMTDVAAFTEKVVFGIDLLCYGLFVLSETLNFLRRRWVEVSR